MACSLVGASNRSRKLKSKRNYLLRDLLDIFCVYTHFVCIQTNEKTKTRIASGLAIWLPYRYIRQYFYLWRIITVINRWFGSSINESHAKGWIIAPIKWRSINIPCLYKDTVIHKIYRNGNGNEHFNRDNNCAA